MKKTINSYLKDLESFLAVIPKKDRDTQIMEIRDHLLQAVQDGNNEHEVLMDFLPPEELGKDIISEYKKLYNFSIEEETKPSLKTKKITLKRVLLTLSIILLIWIVLLFGPLIKYKNNTPTPIEEEIIEYEKNE